MFCHKCGTQLHEDSAFCHKCGTNLGYKTENSTELKSTEQQSVNNLCVPMCILRFIDAAIWTIIVILQISSGLGFLLIIWNVIATGKSYMYAVELLGVCRSNTFSISQIDNIARQNRAFSGIGTLWFGVQLLFLYSSDFLFLAMMVEIAIFILAAITLSRLSKITVSE